VSGSGSAVNKGIELLVDGPAARSTGLRLSIVIPVYNEEATIVPFFERCAPAVEAALDLMGEGAEVEWVFVNDGSSDGTGVILGARAARDPRVRVVNLSRNFGKEAALAAGLDHADGDAVVPIDVDLQDPPDLMAEMVRLWLEGAKVVNARRVDRSTDGWAKRTTARVYYRLYNRLAETPIPEDVGDFRLMDREAVEVIRNLSEQARFNKGLFSWIGFETATIDYRREARTAGRSKWRGWRLWNFAIDGIVSSSTLPLRVWTYLGAFIAAGSFAYALFLLLYTIITGGDSPGFASIMLAVLLLGGLNMLSLGILGEYVGRIANEVRGRPLYVVASRVGFED
jgi:glycosyltransferase involved in cell wall biosynthesis